jgi:hypothetical protein
MMMLNSQADRKVPTPRTQGACDIMFHQGITHGHEAFLSSQRQQSYAR